MQYGRRAYGSHRQMSPAAKARNVAASIVAHGLDVHDTSVWVRYGLETNAAQQQLVLKAFGQK